MQKLSLPLASVLFFNIIGLQLFGQSSFVKTFGGPQNDFGMAVQQTRDGGYALFGQTQSFGHGQRDMYLIKCDRNGKVEWEQAYGRETFDWGISMQETSDEGFIMCGAFSNQDDSFALVKVDRFGNEEWTRLYRGSMTREVGRFVQQTMDGGYIAIGFTGPFPEEDILLIKVDEDGNEQWINILSRQGRQYGNCIRQTEDGGYIIVGESNHDTLSKTDIYVVRANEMGDSLWTMTYGTDGHEMGWSIAITPDGGYAFVGFGYGEESDIILVKTDQAGMEEWSKRYGGIAYDEGYSMQCTPDGGYILAGSKGNDDNNERHLYGIKTDAGGNVLWEKVYPRGYISDAVSVDLTEDGGFVFAGTVLYLTDSVFSADMYLVKTDSLGYALSEANPNNVSFEINPNPVADVAMLTINDPYHHVDAVEIVDVNGRSLDAYTIVSNEAVQMHVNQLAAGVYFVVLRSGKKVVASGKMFVP